MMPFNVPALTVWVVDMLATLRKVAGAKAADHVTVTPDPAVEAVVGYWHAVLDRRRGRCPTRASNRWWGPMRRSPWGGGRSPGAMSECDGSASLGCWLRQPAMGNDALDGLVTPTA